jgi:hypothetical protein
MDRRLGVSRTGSWIVSHLAKNEKRERLLHSSLNLFVFDFLQIVTCPLMSYIVAGVANTSVVARVLYTPTLFFSRSSYAGRAHAKKNEHK